MDKIPSKRRPAKPFKGDEGKRFSSTYQPPSNKKSLGVLKNKTLKELLTLKLSGTDDNSVRLRELLASFLNISMDELNDGLILRNAMDLRMIQKVLSKSDTNAYRTLYELAGLSEQELKVNMPAPIIIDCINDDPAITPDAQAAGGAQPDKAE